MSSQSPRNARTPPRAQGGTTKTGRRAWPRRTRPGTPPRPTRRRGGRDLFAQCNRLTALPAAEISRTAPRYAAAQLRRLLQAYMSMPFRDDALVVAVADKVRWRLLALEAPTNAVDLENLTATVVAGAAAWRRPDRAATTDGDDSGSGNSEGEAEEERGATVSRVLAAAGDIASRQERVGRGTVHGPDKLLRDVEEGAAFELGRALELIDAYHRIEFQSKRRRKRYEVGKGIRGHFFTDRFN